MFGPIGSELINIFRLLSPSEIDRYIDKKQSTKIEGALAAGGERMEFNTQDSNLEDAHKEQLEKNKQAKIIPISDYQNEEEPKKKNKSFSTPEKDLEIKSDENVHVNANVTPARSKRSTLTDFGLEEIGVLSAQTIREKEAQRLAKENSNKDSATVFLLKQRQNMRNSKKKLVEQQAHKQYRSNAAQEFYKQTEEQLLDEDENPDASKGILINKKHY